MSEQPASALFEAVRLVEVLRKRINGGSGSGSGDVWSDATSEAWGEHIATGAPECRYCPVCRAIAASRTSGPDVLGHVMSAGESLFAALRETVAGFERTKPAASPRHEPGDAPADGGRPQGE
ncbi:MAG: hypothetical protein ACRDP6_03030 [Actinoallomurus sp.]